MHEELIVKLKKKKGDKFPLLGENKWLLLEYCKRKEDLLEFLDYL